MKNLFASLGISAAVLIGAPAANAATFNIDFSFGSEGVTGTIVTDCDSCFLQQSNVTSWSLNFSGTVTGSASSGPLNQSPPGISGSPLEATGGQLLYVASGGGSALFTDFASVAQLEFGFNFPDGTIHVQDAAFNSTSAAVTQPFVLGREEIVSTVPLPGTLPLFASGLGALGLLGRRRKQQRTL